MIAVEQQSFEEDIDKLLSSYVPITRSNEKRHEVISFIRNVVTRRLGHSFLIECGSSALRSYLPESDLDMVLLTPGIRTSRDEMNVLTAVFAALCEEVSDKEEGRSEFVEMTIRNVEFVNARTKLAHCLVNNIAVDITINQIGAMTTLAFLEEVDQIIGYSHLFKRSVLLVKSWCQHESSKYCGVSVLGAKVGMLSSYSISIMVLHLFNKFSANLMHPFSVLRSFFYTYTHFPWDTHVLTLEGPQPIVYGSSSSTKGVFSDNSNGLSEFTSSNTCINSDGSPAVSGSTKLGRGNPHSRSFNLGDPKYMVYTNRFTELLLRYRKHPAQLASITARRHSSYKGGNPRFSIRCCNIQDPIDTTNNLGISVSRMNLQLIQQAFRCGYQHMENSLAHYAASCAAAATAAEMEIQQHNFICHDQQYSELQTSKNDGVEVKARLEPVPPSNLGFIGSPVIVRSDSREITTSEHINNQHKDDFNQLYVDGRVSDTEAIRNSECVGIASMDDYSLQQGQSISPERPLSRGFNPKTLVNLFLQEFFPILLNIYGGAGAMFGGSAVTSTVRHDLMEHPLQAIAASRGQSGIIFGNRQGRKRSNSRSSNKQSIYTATEETDSSETFRPVTLSDGASVCSEATEATSSTCYGSFSAFNEQVDNEDSQTCGDPLAGDLAATHSALQLGSAIFILDALPANERDSPSVMNEYNTLVAEVGHLFSHGIFEPLSPTNANDISSSFPGTDQYQQEGDNYNFGPRASDAFNTAVLEVGNTAYCCSSANLLLFDQSSGCTTSSSSGYSSGLSSGCNSGNKYILKTVDTTAKQEKGTIEYDSNCLAEGSSANDNSTSIRSDEPSANVKPIDPSSSYYEKEEDQNVTDCDNNNCGKGISYQLMNQHNESAVEDSVNNLQLNSRIRKRQDNLSDHRTVNTLKANEVGDNSSSVSADPIAISAQNFPVEKEVPTIIKGSRDFNNDTSDTESGDLDNGCDTIASLSWHATFFQPLMQHFRSLMENYQRRIYKSLRRLVVRLKLYDVDDRAPSRLVRSCYTIIERCLQAYQRGFTMRKITKLSSRKKKKDKLPKSYLDFLIGEHSETSNSHLRSLAVALFYSLIMIYCVNACFKLNVTDISLRFYSPQLNGRSNHTPLDDGIILESSAVDKTIHGSNSMQIEELDFKKCLEHFSIDNLRPGNEKYPIGHWVKLGDSISFGDFSSYNNEQPLIIERNLTPLRNDQNSDEKPDISDSEPLGNLKSKKFSSISPINAAMGRATVSSDDEPLLPWGDNKKGTTSEKDGKINSSSSLLIRSTGMPIGKGMQDLYQLSIAEGASDEYSLYEYGEAITWGDIDIRAGGESEKTLGKNSSADISLQSTEDLSNAAFSIPFSTIRHADVHYQWSKDGVNISNIMGNVPYFTLRRSRMSDAGRYQCLKYYTLHDDELHNGNRMFEFEQPEIIVDTNIRISREPKVRTRPSYQEVATGSTVLLNLAADGTPPPSFQWFKNGYKMPGQEASALVMDAVNSSHSGTYSCEVKNIAGSFVWLEATVVVV